ncbi:MAG: cytochrome c peroxidase [bacterium]
MKRKVFAVHDVRGLLAVALVFILLMPSLAWSVEPPPSLKTVPLPEIPNLDQFIKDQNAAIQLGKALFWDIQLGSDGQACASCHFQAGADPRIKNQITPGLPDARFPGGDTNFGNNPVTGNRDYPQFSPNYTLKAEDFPLTKLADPDDPNSIIADTNDVISSLGVFLAKFLSTIPFSSKEKNIPQNDPVFSVGCKNVRRVEPRNTPTVINAAFNFTNFWDGRANNIFNGVNPFGASDQKARIYVNNNGKLQQEIVRLQNSSLASQAVGPPLSVFEMSFQGREFANIGRKMLSLTPLGKQMVHPEDSVLGPLSRARLDAWGRLVGNPGLTVSYATLIKKAFYNKYWDSTQPITLEEYIYQNPDVVRSMRSPLSIGTGSIGRGTQKAALRNSLDLGIGSMEWGSRGASLGSYAVLGIGSTLGRNSLPSLSGDKFTQMEANFSLFFGLAILMYERTLIADDTLYDQYREGRAELTPLQLEGLDIFLNKGKCINCHGGAEFTNASVSNTKDSPIERMFMAVGEAFYDDGFYNIGVRPTLEDSGRGGNDPFASPLSFSRLAFLKRGINPPPGLQSPVRQIVGDFGDFIPDLPCPIPCDLNRVAVDGAFKTPSVRTAELTGPYFHNGGKATLRQVVDFYDRGGDFARFNILNLDPDIQELNLTEQEKEALVAFMLTLTDERVKFQKAPFDHPQLFVSNGQKGDGEKVIGNSDRYTRLGFMESDIILEIPAVGKNGSSEPIQRFLNLNPFQPE